MALTASQPIIKTCIEDSLKQPHYFLNPSVRSAIVALVPPHKNEVHVQFNSLKATPFVLTKLTVREKTGHVKQVYT